MILYNIGYVYLYSVAGDGGSKPSKTERNGDIVNVPKPIHNFYDNVNSARKHYN